MLTLFLDQQDCFFEGIGFDVPSYENGSGDPADPNSSDLGVVLERVGLRYNDGDGVTDSHLFPSHGKASVALVLALALLIFNETGYLLDCAAKLAAIPASESLAGGTCPVATVGISGGGFR